MNGAVNRTTVRGHTTYSAARRPATVSASQLTCTGGPTPNERRSSQLPLRTAVAGLVTGRRLAVAAIGLVGLHVVDDNFIQPEPGTSAVDHLPGGLALLALVAAGAWAYPRVRAGAQAAIALLTGFLGVLASTEAVYYTAADAPSGDDFTGFLSLARRLRSARHRHQDALAEPPQRRQPSPPLHAPRRLPSQALSC